MIKTSGMLILLLISPLVHATTFEFSWSGYVEPIDSLNGWQLDGDGMFGQPYDDGTPFNLTVRVKADAEVQEHPFDNYRLVFADSVELVVNGLLANITSPIELSFWDDRSIAGLPPIDSISVGFHATLFGSEYRFNSTAFLDPLLFSFDALTNGATIPFFTESFASSNTGSYREDNVLVTVVDGTRITGVVVPVPAAFYLFLSTLFMTFSCSFKTGLSHIFLNMRTSVRSSV